MTRSISPRRRTVLRGICSASLVAFFGLFALADPGLSMPQGENGASVPNANVPKSFGPGQSALSIGAMSFVARSSFDTYQTNLQGAKYGTSGVYAALDAAINLPTGAVLDQFQFEVYQNDGSSDISVSAVSCSGNPAGAPCAILGNATSSGTPGWTYATFTPTPTTIDNANNQYFVEVFLPNDGGDTALRRVVVLYHLQVSPAPPTATFNDVPTSDPGFQYIEAFVAAGITAGCGGGNYCPDAMVTRRQMAVFFAKALGLYWPD